MRSIFPLRLLSPLVLVSALLAAGAARAAPADGAFVTGGSGEEERAELRAVAPDYNLRLVFAETPGGAYLADVTVLIETAAHQTLFGWYEHCGPLLYVKLPVGAYRVRALSGGVLKTTTVRVGAAGARAEHVIYWPANPANVANDL